MVQEENRLKIFSESDEIYKTVFYNSPLGIFHFDKTSQIIDCNNKFSEIIGSSREVLLNINLLDDLTDKKLKIEIHKTLTIGFGYFDGDYHTITSNKIIPIIARFSAIYADNEIIGGVGLLEDNTERKLSEEKLKESEYYLREAQEFARVGHWKKNLITNDVSRSKELFHIYNLDFNNKEITKEAFYNVIHPEDVEKIKKAYLDSLENKTEYNFFFRLVFPDGTTKYVNEKGKTEYNNEGKPVLSMGIVQDITQIRKKELTQVALFKISDAANSDKSLKELYGSIHKIIGELMPADNFYIALYNEETQILSFPYHVDEKDAKPEPGPLRDGLTEYVLTQKKSCIITEEIDKQLQMEGKVGISGEFTKIWVGIYLNFESAIKGVLVIQDYNDENAFSPEDIELLEFVSKQVVKAIDKKYADEKLVESQKALIKSNADKDKFFSIISHDLKSPFQGIMGMSDLLNESMGELTKEENIEFNGLLNGAIKDVYALIEQLLEWSRVQTGRMEYKPTELNLKSVFSKVISIANISAQKKKIRISCKTDDDLFVHADSMMLETILRNLIANSIKFTTDGGEILINGIISDGKALIKVQDSGIGMSEEVQRKLFKIEEHHTTLGTEGEKGTGLGLVLCRDLVEKNKGKIWVESELRIGSSFYFTLPIGVNANRW